MTPERIELVRFPTADALVADVAARWVDRVAAAAAADRPHHVALPGGRLAGRFMARAVADAAARGVRWDPAEFFWADERCVPPDDADSNYRVAELSLLRPCGVPPRRIHRLQGEIDPAMAATAASDDLARSVPAGPDGVPALDLVLLGMGEDGHVASLFPDARPEVTGSRAWVLPVIGPKPPPQRLTLTFRVLAAAHDVWVLASGAGKERALADSLSPGMLTPLGRLLELRVQTRIFTDIPVLA